MKVYSDGFEKRFDDYQEFMDFIAERRATQCLIDAGDVSVLKLLPQDDLDVAFGVEKELRDDTDTAGTGLYWQTGDGRVIPSRSAPLSQALNQLGCRGQFLERLGNEGFADLMNGYVFPYARGPKKIFMEDGKASGFVSATEFTEIPAYDVMGTVTQFFAEEFPKAEFESGTFTHEYTWAVWSLESHMDRFSVLDGTGIIPKLTVVTSDCGLSSVTVRPYMKGKHFGIPVRPLRVQHRGKAGLGSVRAELEKAYSMVIRTLADLEALKEVPVNNPVSTLKRLMKEEKLPKREALEAAEHFRLANGDGPCTAFDCYMAVCEVLQLLPGEMSAEQRFRAEDSVCRCMSARWHDYDLPGDFSW